MNFCANPVYEISAKEKAVRMGGFIHYVHSLQAVVCLS